MNKIVIALFAVLAVVAAEPPSSYGAPSAFSSFNSFSSSSSGGYDSNDADQFVDSELLARVAQILEQNEASSSRAFAPPSDSYGPPQRFAPAPRDSYGPPSESYGAPAPAPSDSYGPPQRFAPGPSRSSSGVSLGRPERAQRVAEFDLSSSSNSGFRSGGYQ